MENEKTWIALAGRLEMKRFFYWIAVANAILFLAVCLSALLAFLAMTFGLAFWAVRTAVIVFFGLLIFFGLRFLKKAFDATRHDLHIAIEEDQILFKKQGKVFSQSSINDVFEFLIGPTTEMGLGFVTQSGAIRVGCHHQRMGWRDGVQVAFNFELEPSDFIRLVGELGLEEKVEQKA